MLQLIYGTDSEKVFNRLKEITHTTSHQIFDSESFDQEIITQSLSSGGLFDETKFFVFRNLVGDEMYKNFITDHIESFKDAKHTFIFVEGKLLKKDLKIFEKYHIEKEEHNLAKQKEKKSDTFNIFTLSDAFGARDKKKLWILFREALNCNISPEEIHGILWWQIKNMMLVQAESENPGLHPFVYGKVQKALQQYTEQELKDFSQKHIIGFHETRRGNGVLEHELEKFILEL